MDPEFPTTRGDSTPGLPDAALRALDVGQLIGGRFRLVRPLGKGGMGVVWLAKDESLGEEVAFKFLAEVVAQDEAALHDLKRELRRTRQLTHHHIIRVHDIVEDSARGVAGITMEVAAGGSLAARRAKTEHGWFEPHEIAEWIRQLGEALDYAHRQARVVHRDLKPANLLLDAEDRLKIADFGIAAALHESATRLTAGKVSGTPLYMSPEQWQGFPPTPSDDLYAFGATLYELLTGKPPFYSGNVAAAAMGLEPTAMTERRRELEGVEAPVPAEWEEAVAALLAKTAEERPASAGEVLARLGVAAPSHDVRREPIRVPRSPASVPATSPGPTGDSAAFVTADMVTAEAVAAHLPETGPAASRAKKKTRGSLLAAGAAVLLTVGGLAWWFGRDPVFTEAKPTPGPSAAVDATPQPKIISTVPAPPPRPAPTAPAPVRLPIGSGVRLNPFTMLFDPPWGYIDATGQVVIERQWEMAAPFTEGLGLIQQNGKYGYIDPSGKFVIPAEWERASSFADGLALVVRNAKHGYIDATGKLVIPLQWDRALSFSEGLAAVGQADRFKEKWGFIDTTGQVVIPLEWDRANPFAEARASVRRDNPAGGSKWGFLDRSGQLVIPLEWVAAGSFSERRAAVRQGDSISGRYGYIDLSGKLVIQPMWDGALPFSEGVAPVQQGSAQGKFGYIDGSGKLATQLEWDYAGPFFEGLAPVEQKGKKGFIDRDGKIAIPLEWDSLIPVRHGKDGPIYRLLFKKITAEQALAVWLDSELKEIWRAELPFVDGTTGKPAAPAPTTPAPAPSPPAEPVRLVVGSKVSASYGITCFVAPFGYIDQAGQPVLPPQWDLAFEFSEGLAWVRRGDDRTGKFGFIDTSGKLIGQFQWDYAYSFASGMAPVRRGDKWGFVDTFGKLVIPLQWKFAWPFSHGLAAVDQGGKWGYIDTTGAMVIRPKWTNAWSFAEGLANVQQGNKYGYIDQTGALVLQPQWEIAGLFDGGLAPVQQGRKWGFIDKTGKLVLPTRWDYAFPFVEGYSLVEQGRKRGYIDREGEISVPVEWDSAETVRTGRKGFVYRQLLKKIAPGKALAVYLGPDLKEIWRAEMPLVE